MGCQHGTVQTCHCNYLADRELAGDVGQENTAWHDGTCSIKSRTNAHTILYKCKGLLCNLKYVQMDWFIADQSTMVQPHSLTLLGRNVIDGIHHMDCAHSWCFALDITGVTLVGAVLILGKRRYLQQMAISHNFHPICSECFDKFRELQTNVIWEEPRVLSEQPCQQETVLRCTINNTHNL